MKRCGLCGASVSLFQGFCDSCGAVSRPGMAPNVPGAGFDQLVPHIPMIAICTGATISLYFMFVFDVAAPGSQVVNLGLLNTRTNGVILGLGVALVGGMVYAVQRVRPVQPANPMSMPTQVAVPIPPPKPPGFPFRLSDALNYAVDGSPKADATVWRGDLYGFLVRGGQRMTYSDQQTAWGAHYGMKPVEFVAAVRYVESLRAYLALNGADSQRHAGASVAIRALAWTFGIGVALIAMIVAGVMLSAALQPKPKEEPLPIVRQADY